MMTSQRTLSSLARTVAAAVAIASLPCIAPAATIVGGSDLLSAADADQLEAWLGEGPLTLTNIFDKAAGNTGDDFHTAADGMGRTFSIVELVGDFSGHVLDEPIIVGGYNPLSWNSLNAWNVTPLDADRTAFVFNLNLGMKFDQRRDSSTINYGYFQTYGGDAMYFGGGFDLYVDWGLYYSSSYLYSYGSDDDRGKTIIGYPNVSFGNYLVGQMEVFTISAVPEPETWMLMLGGLGMLGVAARRRRA